MLCFHFLNVSHGLSVVVEHEHHSGKRYFGIVDSNASAGDVPRGLSKLRQIGADTLSFICLTHPHRDHFSGLFSIIQEFRGKVSDFYSFPMGDVLTNTKRLKALGAKLLRLLKSTDSPEIRNAALELLQIIRWGDSREAVWYECAGDLNVIAPPGFDDVEVATILPPRLAKGHFIQQIERQDVMMLGSFEDNRVSLALQFVYGGEKSSSAEMAQKKTGKFAEDLKRHQKGL